MDSSNNIRNIEIMKSLLLLMDEGLKRPRRDTWWAPNRHPWVRRTEEESIDVTPTFPDRSQPQ